MQALQAFLSCFFSTDKIKITFQCFKKSEELHSMILNALKE